MSVQKNILKKAVYSGAAAILFLCGCSDKKAAPLPKTHPDLLFEICENGKANDYTNMLPKIQRLRAIDQSSVFLAELENTAKVNVLVDEVNRLTASGKFKEALKSVNDFEQKNGMSSESGRVREFLADLIRLDEVMAALNAPRNSSDFRKNLDLLDNLDKKIVFSEKIRNFSKSKRSEFEKYKAFEYGSVCFNLWSEALFFKKSNPEGCMAFAALLGTTESNFPGFSEIFSAEDVSEKEEKTSRDQLKTLK